MVEISPKSEVATWFFRRAEAPIKGAYNNQKKLKLWESALFSG